VSCGLEKFYPDYKSVIIVSDGGSTDDTREKAESVDTGKVEKIATIYRGPAGKGSALRAVFAAVCILKAKAGLCLDADLRSIKPDWVKKMIGPIIEERCDFVAPLYLRHKYDATITNDIAHGYRIGESPLGAKSHNPKDPISLTPMFRQVVGTMFNLAEKYEKRWKKIRGSVNPRITGKIEFAKPDKVTFSVQRLEANFRAGWERFSPLWERILERLNFKHLLRVKEGKDLLYSSAWAKIVYDYMLAYHKKIDKIDKSHLLWSLVPIYQIRVASFIKETEAMNNEQAERLIESQALTFEDCKSYLVERWNE